MDDATPRSGDNKLIRDQVDDLYNNLGYANGAVILIATFLTWILWPVASDNGLRPWYACLLLLNLWNIVLALLYRYSSLRSGNVQSWLKTYVVGVFLSGLCWGSLLLFVVPPNQTIHLLAAAFIVAGLVTGSAATLASLKFGFAVFSVPSILPGAIYLIWLNQPLTFIIGWSLVCFLVFILFIALRIHRTLYYSLRKQVEVGNQLSLLETTKRELEGKLDVLKRQLEQDQVELEQLRSSLKHKPSPGANLRRAQDFRDMRFISLLDKLTGGVWDLNMKTGEISFSPGWLEMLGYDKDDPPQHMDFWQGILHPDDRLGVLNKLHAFADGSLPEFSSSHRLRTKSGEWMWVMARAHGVIWGSFGELLNIAGMELHVPESGEAAGKSLDLLNFDINAWLVRPEDFQKRFRQLVATASLEGIEHSLCHIRIVRPHDVQDDTAALDEIRLYEMGRVLLNEFRHGDALMRLGKDSFALLMAFCKPEDAWGKALALQQSMRSLQVNFKGRPVPLVVGIGITPITAAQHNLDELLQDAATACELAISGSPNLVYLFQRDNLQLGTDLFERHLIRQIQDGIHNHDIHIRATPLQPLANDADAAEQIVVVSATLESSAQEPNAGNAKGSGRNNRLATSIDVHVIGNIMAWLAQDHRERIYFYECSEASCGDLDFIELVRQQLARLPVHSATLCLGIPENAWRTQAEPVARLVQVIREAGGRIALTRYGNTMPVNQLVRECKLDYLKLDPALLQGLEHDRSIGITLKYINDILHLAGVKSIVSDVPGDLPIAALQAMHVDFLQPGTTRPDSTAHPEPDTRPGAPA